jgi:hypothetical protein
VLLRSFVLLHHPYPLRGQVTRRVSGQNGGVTKRNRTEGGRWHRFMFSIMGPAQVGPYTSSEPVADTSRCERCGTPWNDHEVVRTATRAYSRCPTT